jgi:cation diffusion facilitator family transporter
MHQHNLDNWQHSHDFAVNNARGERRTGYVLLLTAVTMVIEILAGSLYGSMALLADGWHMGTHVAAFMITLFAYRYARRHGSDPAYAFGTGKVSVLGGFASAIALAVVALMMLLESLFRFFDPQAIQFTEAIAVACLGLFINLLSAYLLGEGHHHHEGAHGHDHAPQHHHDHNLRAAYMHVLADALTSVLAIAALLLGMLLGWNWMDPLMGVVGAVIITRWSVGLLQQSGPILLDGSIDEAYRRDIVSAIERDADNRVADVHVWKVGPSDYAVIISLVTHSPRPPQHYKSLLPDLQHLSHVTIEVNPCEGETATCAVV